MDDKEQELNSENEQPEDKMMCSHAEKLDEIKYGIIAQIIEAGRNFENYDLKSRDKKGVLSYEKKIELQTRLEIILDTYYDVVNLVWNNDCEGCDGCETENQDVCKDCQDKREGKLNDKIGGELKDILNKKLNKKVG